MNGIREGYGRFIWGNGDYYEGSWLKGRYHGVGKEVSQGKISTGLWKDDELI